MKKLILILFIALLCLKSHEQIVFEKGYFIDENSLKTECLIKNVDWRNNPSEFNYKTSDSSEVRTAGIITIREFGIDNISRYIKAEVKMDRSSEVLSELSPDRNPQFNTEIIFLKVLVEGKASLFQYEDKNLSRFFYSIDDSLIVQLVYKLYSVDSRKISYNYHFRQQLQTDLKCDDISINDIGNLNYFENDLKRLFIKYNECQNVSYVNYKEKHKRDLFDLNIRPGMNFSNFSMNNELSDAEDADFDTKLTLRAALEFEIIFPFNKSKWALMAEPTFQYYKSYEESEGVNDQEIEVDYKSIELPIGIRHYFYLDENSRIFINGSYVLDFCFNSVIKYELGWEYEISTMGCLSFGVGYKYKRFGFEARYLTSRNLLTGYSLWNSDYKTGSLILSYSIF